MTGSVSNKEDAGLANIVVKLLVEGRSVNARHIGVIVITPYDAQTNLIRDLLTRDASLKAVEVANIDAFQGREKDVIVVSLVRSNSDGFLGFVDDMRRINVALTRAMRGLVVIGDM